MTNQATLLGAMGAALTAAAQHSATPPPQGLTRGQIWNVPAQPVQPNVGYGYAAPNTAGQALQQSLGGALGQGGGQIWPNPIWDVFAGDGPLVDSNDPQLSARIRVAERVLQRSNGRRYREIARDIVALLDAMHLQEAFDLEGTIE